MRIFLVVLLVFPIALAGHNTHVATRNSSAIPKETAQQQNQYEEDDDPENASCDRGECAAYPAGYDSDSKIVRVALSSHPRSARLLDCSHFVHAVYQRAGSPYPYASSTDLYLGISNFRRVSTPQSGDLAVWRGHVGIVVDPQEHTFLSVLHTGPSVDYYDSKYWKHRGRPRFFRYLRSSDTLSPAPVHSASLNRVEDPGAEPEIVSASAGPQAEQDYTSAAAFAKPYLGSSAGVTVASAHPSPAEIASALTLATAQIEAGLQGRNLYNLARPVVVFDNIEVMQVHVAKNGGWADVKIDEVMLLAKGRVQAPNDLGPQRWILKRTGRKSWQLSQPSQFIFVPQQIAERLVSHQLAQLTEANSNSAGVVRQKAELASLLNLLFSK